MRRADGQEAPVWFAAVITRLLSSAQLGSALLFVGLLSACYCLLFTIKKQRECKKNIAVSKTKE